MMMCNGGKFVIVQFCVVQVFIVSGKFYWFDDMQMKVGISVKMDDVVSIWWNFWFVKYDVQYIVFLVWGQDSRKLVSSVVFFFYFGFFFGGVREKKRVWCCFRVREYIQC